MFTYVIIIILEEGRKLFRVSVETQMKKTLIEWLRIYAFSHKWKPIFYLYYTPRKLFRIL